MRKQLKTKRNYTVCSFCSFKKWIQCFHRQPYNCTIGRAILTECFIKQFCYLQGRFIETNTLQINDYCHDYSANGRVSVLLPIIRENQQYWTGTYCSTFSIIHFKIKYLIRCDTILVHYLCVKHRIFYVCRKDNWLDWALHPIPFRKHRLGPKALGCDLRVSKSSQLFLFSNIRHPADKNIATHCQTEPSLLLLKEIPLQPIYRNYRRRERFPVDLYRFGYST